MYVAISCRYRFFFTFCQTKAALDAQFFVDVEFLFDDAGNRVRRTRTLAQRTTYAVVVDENCFHPFLVVVAQNGFRDARVVTLTAFLTLFAVDFPYFFFDVVN